ncbi:prolyl 4-hydroxylase subunit alpha-1-like [Episyrphus balteatus]|uniref:prolyl 4-hydroxylase subunit alpha-1-like n=1 Tax=Episyrphus balteatus TaxID=286459 RepID=UPI002485864B|nr:prolyl 4-hydroxylase subunit alpha-1-like [Episyrphus balteatus]
MFSAGAICCLSVLLLLQTTGSNGYAEKEYFTSIAGLEKLLSTEVFLLSHLQSYVQSMTSQLEMLKSEIQEIEKEHNTAANDLEEYLTSPVNAYLLIKRLDKDWSIFEDAIENDVARNSFLEALKFSRSNLSFPTDEDTTGSVVALVRLQETYQLETSEVASGILNGVKYGSSMTWQDCFQLGSHLFTLKDFNHTIPWLKESYQKLQAQEYFNSSESIAFMEMVANIHVQMGDFKTALDLNNRLLELEPEKESAMAFKKYLEVMIEQGHGLVVPELNKDIMTPYRQTEEFKTYEKVCRGEIKQSPKEERPLRCKNYHRNVPYRLLMPFKMEELNMDPYVVVFHDVIYDSEIEPIKEYSKPSMARSQVRTHDGEGTTATLYRTSQNTWLKYNVMRETKRLRRRLGDITGLDMLANEELQVANYGIGGHYEPHFDFFENDNAFEEQDGNRIATAIFYLTDVEQGGATGFPYLKRAVQPKKGSLMFWYNLHKDGEKDFRTKHAACPVLKGSKWVANVWIRSRRQMFHRPCDLEQDHVVSIPYKLIR